jgi:hypothetical protein
MKTTTQELEKRTIRKDIFLTKVEIATIQEAAELAGLKASEWVRQVALIESRKKVVAKRFANKLHESENFNR